MMSKTRGFTFVEMLVVMIVIGILAALAIPKLQNSKSKGVVAAMTSDLRAIAEEQEAYYFQNRTYTTNLAALNANPTTGNTIVINEGTASGWSGTLSNGTVSQKCYVFTGTAAPVGTATKDGVIDCS